MEDEEVQDVRTEAYQNNLLSLLGFKRNNNEHPKISVSDLDETEMLLARMYAVCLPKLIKGLLKESDMRGK